MLQEVLVVKTENRLDWRYQLTGFITQHAVHGWSIHNLVRIEDILGIPGFFDFLHQTVVPFTYHGPDKFTPQAPITMLAT